MAYYRLKLERVVRQQLRRTPGNYRQRIAQTIDSLAREPRPHNSKKLDVPYDVEARRIRLDNWRIVYVVDESAGCVTVLAVRKRPPYDYSDLLELLQATGL
jgi:mRNA-degrading endonuclease RelE of RelBE toxin-antitoxin system